MADARPGGQRPRPRGCAGGIGEQQTDRPVWTVWHSTTDDAIQCRCRPGSGFSLRNDDARASALAPWTTTARKTDDPEMTHRFANRGQGRRASRWLNWQVKRD